MNVEVINTGTELLLGNVTNTHLTFLGQALFPLGLRVDRQVCVPDGPAIREALLDAFPRAGLVLVTGGLGPTSDDLTRDIAAELLGRPLVESIPAILDRLKAFFRKVNRPFPRRPLPGRRRCPPARPSSPTTTARPPASTCRPARFPGDPGDPARRTPHVFILPGPPRELRPMFTNHVAPMIEKLLPVVEGPPHVLPHLPAHRPGREPGRGSGSGRRSKRRRAWKSVTARGWAR